MIKDDDIRNARRHSTFHLFQFSAADQRGGVGFLTSLEKLGDDVATSAGGQFAQLSHGFLRRELAMFFRMGVQMGGRGVSRDARAGRHLTRWRSPDSSSCNPVSI